MSLLKSHPDLENGSTTTAAGDHYGNGIGPANANLLNGHRHNNNGDAMSEANGTTKTVPYATAGANGSIITMTLKNNHLIVETEERSDISRDARETKMHYSPSDKDGVFVVEVARGADTSYHSPRAAIAQQQFDGVDLLNTSSTPASVDGASSGGNLEQQQQQQQRVQVHHHAPPSANAEPASALNGTLKSNAGLSQSDLSDSSSAGSNKDYNYGNQGGPYAGNAGGGRAAIISGHIHHPHLKHPPVAKQETIDLEPRLQSDIDLLKVETERREHCNGHAEEVAGTGNVLPDILVKSSAAEALPVATAIGQTVES